MPEINQVPALSSVVEQNPNIGKTMLAITEAHHDLSTPEYAEIRLRIDALRKGIRADYPNLPDDAFEAVSQLFVGPWLMPKEALQTTTVTEQQKELRARMQHEFVHHIFFAMTDRTSKAYRMNTYFMLQAMEKSAISPPGLEHNIPTFLNGVKSELAVIRTLLDNGDRVILPNYLKRTDQKLGRLSETLEWDVRSGVDLIGVSPEGTVFLIDAKGRKYVNEGVPKDELEIKTDVTIDDQVTLQGLNFLPLSLAAKINSMRQEAGNPQAPVKRLRIIIPTDSSHLGRLGTTENSTSYSDALNKFALLKPRHQDAIMSGLSNYD